MSEENMFSGFMPMINQINISKQSQMITTNGDLVNAHTISVTTVSGDNYVFSIDNNDLMKLFFLIMKVVN